MEMSSRHLVIWKLIEILLKGLTLWGGWAGKERYPVPSRISGFYPFTSITDFSMKKPKKEVGSFLRRALGSHRIRLSVSPISIGHPLVSIPLSVSLESVNRLSVFISFI